MFFSRFEQDHCSVHIDVGVKQGPGNRWADAGQGGQMDNYFNAIADRFVHSCTVTDVGFDELEIFVFKTVADVPAFDLWVVKFIEIVSADDRPAIAKKAFA